MTNDFDTNGYVHLKSFLDVDNCRELTNILKQLVEEGKTVNDPQCPISEAIHGNETFDKLLEDLLPHFERASGKRLYPTYSYARLYKSGEELKNHRDRPACEISATLTLGYSGKQWAIYMGDHEDKTNASEIMMNVGDAVLYRGMDKWHWREKFEGDWQAQVFLHYVDADGPHADQKYDGRDSLGLAKHTLNKKAITDFAIFENYLSEKFCNNIIETYKQDTIEKIEPIIGAGKGKVDKSIRDVERVMLPQHAGVGATLTATALSANHYWWQYNITHANQTELLIYKPDGHYNAHVDTFHEHSDEVRKLTALVFLNDDFEGGKFFINSNGTIQYPPQEKGTILVFPSYMVHGVEPVTKGVRYSCVNWLVGPYFK